jgi:hypothetical protein
MQDGCITPFEPVPCGSVAQNRATANYGHGAFGVGALWLSSDGLRWRPPVVLEADASTSGPVLPGSIVERSTRGQRSGCHCRADPPRLHGPYATWIHQEDGR